MDLKKELRIIVKYILPKDQHDKDVIENYVDTLVLINEEYIKQLKLTIPVVSKSLPSNDLASWALRNGWTYNFCDRKWWQLQESQNYIKKTTKEIADMIW